MNKYIKRKAPVALDTELENGEFYAEINQDNANFLLALLTDLYANPARAMARELITNAHDASNGELIRIDYYYDEDIDYRYNDGVYVFVIEDKGCGMTCEELKQNYLTYVNSSKTYDFTSVGAFGLGGKSPLACTDNFEIETTTKVGDKFEVTCARMSKKDGRIVAQIIENKTTNTGETGTKITVPELTEKQIEDIRKYVDFTTLCAPKPVFESESFDEVKKPHYQMQVTDKMRIVSRRPISSYSRMPSSSYHKGVCINGILPYDLSNVDATHDAMYVVDVKSGEFQFAPAREELPTCQLKSDLCQYCRDNDFSSWADAATAIAETLESGDYSPCSKTDFMRQVANDGFYSSQWTKFTNNFLWNSPLVDALDKEICLGKSTLPHDIAYTGYTKDCNIGQTRRTNVTMQDSKNFTLAEEFGNCMSAMCAFSTQVCNLYFVTGVKKNIKVPTNLQKTKFKTGDKGTINMFVESTSHDEHIKKVFKRIAEYTDTTLKIETVANGENKPSKKASQTTKDFDEREVLYSDCGLLQRNYLRNVKPAQEKCKSERCYVAQTPRFSVEYSMGKDRFNKSTLPEIAQAHVIFVKTKKEKQALLDYGMGDFDKFSDDVVEQTNSMSICPQMMKLTYEQTSVLLKNLSRWHYYGAVNVDTLPSAVRTVVTSVNDINRCHGGWSIVQMRSAKYINLHGLASAPIKVISLCTESLDEFKDFYYSNLHDYEKTETYAKYNWLYEQFKNGEYQPNELDNMIIDYVNDTKIKIQKKNYKMLTDYIKEH